MSKRTTKKTTTKTKTTKRTDPMHQVIQLGGEGGSAELVLKWPAGICDHTHEAEIIAAVKAAYQHAYDRGWERFADSVNMPAAQRRKLLSIGRGAS